MSDMSRLEAKVERLTDQLSSKERELQALASKVLYCIRGDISITVVSFQLALCILLDSCNILVPKHPAYLFSPSFSVL